MQGIDHVGIVVKDLEAAIDRYRSVLGLPLGHIESHGEGLLRIAFLPVGGDDVVGVPKIELLEPLREGSSAWNYLQAHGEGIEHVAFLCADIDCEWERLGAAGVPLVDACPRSGAGAMRIAFMDAAALGGVVAELVSPEERGRRWS